jgi:hypothetical protein
MGWNGQSGVEVKVGNAATIALVLSFMVVLKLMKLKLYADLRLFLRRR